MCDVQSLQRQFVLNIFYFRQLFMPVVRVALVLPTLAVVDIQMYLISFYNFNALPFQLFRRFRSFRGKRLHANRAGYP